MRRAGQASPAVLLLVLAVAALPGATLAADPSPVPAAAASPGAGVTGPVDPRSSGEGPGLQAEPLMVAVLVVLLGLAAAGGTALYVRLTRDD